jgi:hypothetical protein
MRSKNAARITADESEHMANVKALPCSLCDAPGPSSAHHIRQGIHYLTVALCHDCHQGHNGWHGNKSLWRIRKMDEIDALAVTIRRLMTGASYG